MGNERVEGYASGFKVGWDKAVEDSLEKLNEWYLEHKMKVWKEISKPKEPRITFEDIEELIKRMKITVSTDSKEGGRS